MKFVVTRLRSGLVLAACGMVVVLSVNSSDARKFTYPKAKKAEAGDTYHGTYVADPYRWLEDPDGADTVDWVSRQNALTDQFIDRYPGRDQIIARFKELWDYPKYSLPSKHGARYVFSKNDGLQNQSVLYQQSSLTGDPTVVIDPNKLSDDGTIALSNQRYNRDGSLLVYGLSASGSDWQELKIRDVDSGKDYDEVIKWCKFSGIGWKLDNSGFFYSRFPADGEVAAEDRNNYSSVWWHQLGTDQSQDVLVYNEPNDKTLGFFPYVSEDGDYLVLWVYRGTDPKNGIYVRRVGETGEFTRLAEQGVASFTPIDNIGSTGYFYTDLDAPRKRVVTIDLEDPSAGWKELIPESDDVIDFVSMVSNHLVVAYKHHAHHQMKIFDNKGGFVRDIELPTIGSIGGLSGNREDSEMFFSFESFLFPTTAYRYDFATDKVEVFRESQVAFDASQYETKQVFVTSKDGTRVPMFVTHRKDIALDGGNHTWLYGYGGFNISLTPSFRISRLLWLESGGVYAVANLRGGDEYGEEWHQGGVLDRKQNVFDDFIACAEYLVENKYTRRDKLAINGGSNGGLLVAACMTQRPDLFGAVVCQVPVIDMLRYHKFTVGRYWVSDYGNAEDDANAFKYLMEYSPLHNVREGESYPPTLVTSADTDDRVVPAHAKKFVARVQAADAGDNPILLRVETKAGHGAGKPTTKIIEELGDIYSFLYQVLNVREVNPQ